MMWDGALGWLTEVLGFAIAIPDCFFFLRPLPEILSLFLQVYCFFQELIVF
jgi:hypothetical protein